MHLTKVVKGKSWIEISKSSLKYNLFMFRKKVGVRKIFCVVKANAYGHGLEGIIRILEKEEGIFFAVDSYEEGMEIRKLGVNKPILILGYTPLAHLLDAIKNGFSLTVYSKATLENIVKKNLKISIRIHLKVETGLNRQGIKSSQLSEILKFIKRNEKYFTIEGISTHFADIEDTLDSSYSKFQLKNFKDNIRRVKKLEINPVYIHCACSAAAILYPDTYFNAVRIGISLYGLWPSKETKLAYSIKAKDNFRLKPILSWKSIIAQIKYINKGESVGYGRTWYALKKSKIAVVPIGYSDGYDRGLSNLGRVIVRNSYAPIIGRIAMNMMVIDVTDVKNVRIEDEVVLIGKAKGKEITVEEIAQKIGTINYEVVSRINPKIKRLLVE